MREFAKHPAARGLSDDAAVLELGDETLVLTHDAMVEGVHWLADTQPGDVAYKLVAVNLSDLAAKGAEPLGVLLGFTLGEEMWDIQFSNGLKFALREFGIPLLGGDSVAAPTRVLGLTAIGRATCRPVPGRNGARAGDGVYLCGTIGEALRGHTELTNVVRSTFAGSDPVKPTRRFVDAFLKPQPLLDEGRALAPLVSAMMDVSDGLLLDAARMAEASGVTIALERNAIPFSAELLAWSPAHPASERDIDGWRDAALRWGDDYALLFTLAAGTEPPVRAQRIGEVQTRGDAPLLIDGISPPPGDRLGYRH